MVALLFLNPVHSSCGCGAARRGDIGDGCRASLLGDMGHAPSSATSSVEWCVLGDTEPVSLCFYQHWEAFSWNTFSFYLAVENWGRAVGAILLACLNNPLSSTKSPLVKISIIAYARLGIA